MMARRDPGALPASDEPPRRLLPRAIARTDVIAKRVIAALVVVGLLGWAASMLASRAGRWLHARAEYAVSFDSIQLDPPPPSYVRGGRRAILGRVQEKSKVDGPIAVLDLDLEDLGRLFAKYSPWVVKVERVRRDFPNRVTVQLVYREPVAWVGSEVTGTQDLAIAADGVVLPADEVTPQLALRLVRLGNRKINWNAVPGRLVAMDDRGEVTTEVVAALRLARFLRAQDGRDGTQPLIAKIYPTPGADKLWIWTQREFQAYWQHAPGDEIDGELKAEEKLQRIAKWELANRDAKPKAGFGLHFTIDSIEYRPNAADSQSK